MGLTRKETPSTPKGQTQIFEEAKFTACPRRQYSQTQQEWIQFTDASFSNFDICPTCYQTSTAHTKYANDFKLVPEGSRSADLSFQCDFGKYWVRIAYLWSLATQRSDLSLMAVVSGLELSQDGECPNGSMTGQPKKVEAHRTWYAVKHPDTGALMDDFTACDCCLGCVKAVLPEIGECLVLASQEPCSAACDVSRTARATEYVNLLLEAAVDTRYTGSVDVRKLIAYIEQFGAFGECPRDGTTNGKCYVLEGLPEFTVCEECFETVIKPAREKGLQMASNFGQPQTIDFSCQLYSTRMRGVWTKSASMYDTSFLQQKVSERKIKFDDTIMQIKQLKMQKEQELQQASMVEQLSR